MERYIKHIELLKEKGSLRFLRETVSQGKTIFYNGKEYLNFSSNDYLGLSAETGLWHAFLKNEINHNPVFSGSSCSSRLLTGNSHEYTLLEEQLAELYKKEVLIFNSGYHANTGILPALTSKKDLIVSDKLVHASLIDGIRLSEAKSVRFRHNDMQHLQDILEKHRKDYDQVFIVTESVFSMDGDTCDLQRLVELKKQYNAMLYLDEAHALGIYGNNGLGLCEEKNFLNETDLIIGTFGKAVASLGAFVACNTTVRDMLINNARTLIFSTALPPLSVKWTRHILSKIVAMNEQRQHLCGISAYFRKQLQKMNLRTAGESQIVPLIVGENKAALDLAEYLQKYGIFVLAVRPPTVPEGTARLRFSLNAQMTQKDIDHVIQILNNR